MAGLRGAWDDGVENARYLAWLQFGDFRFLTAFGMTGGGAFGMTRGRALGMMR